MEMMPKPVADKKPLQQAIEVIWRPHPLLPAADVTHLPQPYTPGQTVRELLLKTPIDTGQPIAIIVDDKLLTVEEWDTVCPKPGQIINVKAEVQGGGGGGSNPLQVVALIAIVVIAAALAAPTGGLSLVAAFGIEASTAAMIAAAFAVAGAMIVNAIFAPSTTGIDTSNNGQYSQPSPTYSLSGGNNRIRPYESMPIVMGEHRFFPDFASRPFTEYHGEDQYLYQIFHLGLSTCDISDWRIGTNPITNYSDYTWHVPDSQGKIKSFPGNVDAVAGAALENASGWITRTTSKNTYRIGIDIEGSLYYANDRGGLDGTSVQIRIQYKPVGSATWIDPADIEVSGVGFVDGRYETYSVWVNSGYWGESDGDGNSQWFDTSHYESRTHFVANGGTVIISGNTQSPRRATLFINPASPGQFDVRIIRDTGDSDNARLQNKTNWSVLRSYQADTASYVGQNRIGITIRASEQLNGAIQQMSCLAAAYAYYWNGSAWVWAKTQNPAHWYMDFAHGRRAADGTKLYGCFHTDDEIDLAGLTAWANFCTNEGLTFNAVIDGNQSAEEILQAIARCGFASPSRESGGLGVVFDERNAPISGYFGMANIIKGSFEVSYITEQLAEEIIVQYKNPSKDWEQDEVRVNVPGVITPKRSSSIPLFGCRYEAMAGKFANYIAAQQEYRTRRITWETDFEGFTVGRGNVVLLSHDLTQWGYSGRVYSADGTTINLGRSVPRSGAIEYLMLVRPDGDSQLFTLPAAAVGEAETIDLVETINWQADCQPMDHKWFFSPLATPGKKVKILSIQPVSESRIRLTATDEDPEFYAAWDGTWQSPKKQTLLNNQPEVGSISVTETLYRGTDSSIRTKVNIQWLARGSYERANIRYRLAGGAWESAQTPATYYQIDTDKIGTIEIEILPIYYTLVGQKSTYSTYLLGVTASPANVNGLTDFYRAGRTVLSWRSVIDPRTIDYEIRKGISWEKGHILGRVSTTEFITDGDGTYWVAAHTGNVYSAEPAGITIDGGALVANVIATFDEEATGWSGTLSGGARRVSTDIVLAGSGLFSQIPLVSAETSIFYFGGVSGTGTYEIPVSHEIDIVASQACSVSVSYRLRADSPFALFSRVPSVAALASVTGNYAGYADCKIQMAVAPDSGIYGEWRDFVPGSYVGRKFKFRAVLSSLDPSVTAILDQMIFSVDVPDRIENGTSINCPSGGLTVTYNPAFQATPNVQITILDAQQGDEVYLPDANQSATGFTVQIRNAGSGVSRKINWLSQGY